MGVVTKQSGPGWRLIRAAAPPPVVPNAEQVEAARSTPGVTVVLGGPGTGKSAALVEAVAARIEDGSRLDRLAVLASSRASAQQLRRAIARRVGGAQVSPRVTTIHGFSLGMLRELGEPEPGFRLLRAPEQEQRIAELLAGLPEGWWPPDVADAARTRAFARQLREVISRARQLSLDPEQISHLAAREGDHLFARFADFFEVYLTVCDMDGSFDYAELIHRMRLLLVEPDAARAVQARFDAVLADDVQDFDPAQVGLLADLAEVGLPVLALGDPQQRIGSFRGATGAAVATMQALPQSRTVALTRGFRTGPAVTEALEALRLRLSAIGAAPPVAPASGPAGVVTSRVHDDEAAEVAHVAQHLRQAVLCDGLTWADMAVIVRAGRTQVGPLARELTRFGVPVDVAGDELPLANQPAVRVLLLALRVAAQEGRPDADQAHRLLTSPLCGLDSVDLRSLGRALLATHNEQGNSVQLLGRCLAERHLLDHIDGEAGAAARRLASTLAAAAKGLAGGARVQDVLWQVWDSTGWGTSLREAALGGSRRAHHHLDAVVELFDLAARREDLAGAAGVRTFVSAVEDLEIPADTGREQDLSGRGVRVLTAHRARSGEWARVFLVGVQEGRWPQLTRRGLLLDPDRLSPDHLDAATTSGILADERRLFLVACSRARREVHVSASQGVEGEAGRPSRFLEELGVPVERVHGHPAGRLSAPALVAELRRVTADPAQTPGLRRAAALRLARLAAVTDADGLHPFRAAAPAAWWGLREPTTASVAPPESLVINGSALRTLLSCPRHWFLSRRARAEGGRASKASVGDVVHILAARAASEGLDAQQVKEELAAVWDRIPFEAEWLSATERTEIDAAVDRFADWTESNGNDVLGVEKTFSVPLEVKGRPVVLRGAVDRLELEAGRLKVIDIKTGRSIMAERDMADFEQLGVYQLAAQLGAFEDLAPGVRAVAPPALVYLRHGDQLPKMLDQASLDDQPALEGEELRHGPTWVHDKLADAVEIIDSGTFEARQCSMCRYCQFSDSCPAQHPGLKGTLG